MYYNIISSMSSGVITPSYTARTTAFATATAITDTTILNALNTFDLGLISNGLDTKMKALYPMVGGTASTHKFNFMDARDLDVAFRLQFNGGWTHSSTGALPNGINAYADTKLNTSTVLGANSAHLGYYSRTNSAVANELSMGNLEITTGGNGLNLVIRRTSDVASFRATDASTNGIVNTTVTDSRGLFVGAITSATSRKFYKNSSLLNTLATNYTWVRGNAEIFIGAACHTTTKEAFSYTNKETAFNCIGDGLTDAEVSNLYTAVQTFNTTLNRQV